MEAAPALITYYVLKEELNSNRDPAIDLICPASWSFHACMHVSVVLQVMEKMLRKHLNEKNLRSRVDELTGSIVLHGNHRGKIVKWLKQMGF